MILKMKSIIFEVDTNMKSDSSCSCVLLDNNNNKLRVGKVHDLQSQN